MQMIRAQTLQISIHFFSNINTKGISTKPEMWKRRQFRLCALFAFKFVLVDRELSVYKYNLILRGHFVALAPAGAMPMI